MGRAKITVRKAHFKRPSPEALEVRARPEWPSWKVAEPGPARTHHTPRATPSASLTARRRGPSVSGASARDQVLMAPFSPQVLSEHGYGQITTEIREGQTFYYAVPEQEPRWVLWSRGHWSVQSAGYALCIFLMDPKFTVGALASSVALFGDGAQ